MIWIGVLMLIAAIRWPVDNGSARAAATATSIAWRSDLDAALAEARRTGRPVLADFNASWCPPCIAMKHEVWPDPAVEREVADRYVPLFVDVERNVTAAERYHVDGIPAILVLDGDGRVERRAGFLDAAAMMQFLRER